MWVVDNRTPYATGCTGVINKNGRVLWNVVVKATYDIINNGQSRLADKQIPPVLVPEFNEKEGESSLAYETDLGLPKNATDVIIRGCAYAPNGRPTNAFVAGFEVSGVCKMLTVRGDRRWERSFTGTVKLSTVSPITKMPLLYERAYGGYDRTDPDPKSHRLDPRNPVGCGVASHPAHLIDKLAANFEYPDQDVARAGPAGFGPLACYWKPRSDFAGTYDAKWFAARKPLLPEDFDERYYQSVPADQQILRPLTKDARLMLTNLSPGGEVSIELPRVHLAFTTYFSSAARRTKLEHRATLNTIIAEPENNRLLMVWSTVLDCGRDIDHIESTRIFEKKYI